MQEHDVDLNVLVYVEDGEYVALALEMDLRGYGSTPDAAIADLDDHVVMQFSFALQTTGRADSAFMSAEDKYFKLYIQAKSELLKDKLNALQGEIENLKKDLFATEIPVRAIRLQEAMKGKYTANHA